MSSYKTAKRTSSDSVSGLGGRQIPYTSTTDYLKSHCVSIKFLDSCMRLLEVIYFCSFQS